MLIVTDNFVKNNVIMDHFKAAFKKYKRRDVSLDLSQVIDVRDGITPDCVTVSVFMSVVLLVMEACLIDTAKSKKSLLLSFCILNCCTHFNATNVLLGL